MCDKMYDKLSLSWWLQTQKEKFLAHALLDTEIALLRTLAVWRQWEQSHGVSNIFLTYIKALADMETAINLTDSEKLTQDLRSSS
jgi:hypothetical protein